MAGKADMSEHLVGQFGVTKKHAAAAVDAVFDFITEALADGDTVQIPGFGSFSVTARPERQGRNPQTGQAITIAASNAVKFKAGKGLKDAVNS